MEIEREREGERERKREGEREDKEARNCSYDNISAKISF